MHFGTLFFVFVYRLHLLKCSDFHLITLKFDFPVQNYRQNPQQIITHHSSPQANLALSPTALLPSPKGSDVKLQPAQLSPSTPCTPLSPTLRPLHLSSEDEDPVSFDSPPEGTPLPSFNKVNPSSGMMMDLVVGALIYPQHIYFLIHYES